VERVEHTVLSDFGFVSVGESRVLASNQFPVSDNDTTKVDADPSQGLLLFHLCALPAPVAAV
jgi:hypothetical protein